MPSHCRFFYISLNLFVCLSPSHTHTHLPVSMYLCTWFGELKLMETMKRRICESLNTNRASTAVQVTMQSTCPFPQSHIHRMYLTVHHWHSGSTGGICSRDGALVPPLVSCQQWGFFKCCHKEQTLAAGSLYGKKEWRNVVMDWFVIAYGI